MDRLICIIEKTTRHGPFQLTHPHMHLYKTTTVGEIMEADKKEE